MKIETALQRKRFTTWLESKTPRTRVGYPGQVDKCPIANYLRSLDLGNVCIAEDIWWIFNAGKRGRLTKWAQDFVLRVDYLNTEYITAGRALRMLETVK